MFCSSRSLYFDNKITRASKFSQWKNSTSVIEWFKAIENKQHHSFICFNIVEFYPSISQDLLNKALDFASAYDNITNDERNIIIHAKNSILIHKQQAWQKKGDTTFDVTMGINRRLSSLSSDKASFDQATSHTKKHSTKADTTTLYTTNRLQLLNGETDNATTSSGTTSHSAKTSTPTSVTDSSP